MRLGLKGILKSGILGRRAGNHSLSHLISTDQGKQGDDDILLMLINTQKGGVKNIRNQSLRLHQNRLRCFAAITLRVLACIEEVIR